MLNNATLLSIEKIHTQKHLHTLKNAYKNHKIIHKCINFFRVLMKLILEFMNGIIENELCKTKLK